MTNFYSFWLHIYMYALECADNNQPTLFSSRIDGALMAATETYEE